MSRHGLGVAKPLGQYTHKNVHAFIRPDLLHDGHPPTAEDKNCIITMTVAGNTSLWNRTLLGLLNPNPRFQGNILSWETKLTSRLPWAMTPDFQVHAQPTCDEIWSCQIWSCLQYQPTLLGTVLLHNPQLCPTCVHEHTLTLYESPQIFRYSTFFSSQEGNKNY